MHIKSFCLLVCLTCLALGVSAAESARLSLFSTLSIRHERITASSDDWVWLRNKRELIIGVSKDEEPPFFVGNDEEYYEGITADVTSLVAQLLRLDVQVVSFPNRRAALAALQDGRIDLVTSPDEGADSSAVLSSRSFAKTRLALFKHQGLKQKLPADLRDVNVAVSREYEKRLRSLYPAAAFSQSDTHDAAIAAASFGHADAYIDDVFSAYYRINRAYYNLIRFERYVEGVDGSSYRYLVRADNKRLQRLLDAAIVAIGEERLSGIAKRWVGNGLIPDEGRIQLSIDEARWIARHPVVRLVINDDLAPLAFFNSKGAFSGIVSDLLEVVSLQTGLQFEVVSSPGGFPEQISALQAYEADLAIMTSSSARLDRVRFSRPIITSPFVLVIDAEEESLLEKENMSGVRLAIPSGHVALNKIRKTYPEATIVESRVALDAMNLVYEGKADAAVVSLATARYYIPRLFRGQLSVAKLLNVGNGNANFAVRRSDSELQSILNKVLIRLPPDEVNAMSNRWRALPEMSSQTWRDYELVIAEIIAVAAFLIMLSLVWVLYLRRQIAARLHAEKALNDQLQFVETLQDSMPPPVYVRDTEGRMISCNRSYLKSIGLTAEQVMHKSLLELPEGHFENTPGFHDNYMKAIRTGETIHAVHQVAIQGRKRWVDHWIKPYQDSTGVTRGVICGWLDITEHQHLVSELEEAKKQADEGSRAKTTFLATMSHEIRTPLNAVIGILELVLKRKELTGSQRDNIEIAYTSAKSLLELIGDILDIARIESGRLSLSLKRANLREIVESVARVFEGLARQKHLKLHLDVDPNINRDVFIDATRFKQILSNLVSNAIKFTDEGAVKIQVVGTMLGSTLLQVNLEVEDSGVGISPADQERLFQPFSQVNQGTDRREGAGLGLVICRSLTEMMGGQLRMSSSLGQGTRVALELQFQVLEPIVKSDKPLSVSQGAQTRCLQVLVVDDHAVNRQILRQQLTLLGHEVTEAANGHEALVRWSEQPFDMIITDCRMPQMSGHELAQAIRREEQRTGETASVILGLTADAQPEEIERCIEAGMNDCLVKPIGLDVLEDRLLRASEGIDQVDKTECTVWAERLPEADHDKQFDLSSLSSLAGGDPVLFERLINELIASNQQDIDSVEALILQRDFAELAELAHRVKGAARVVRAGNVVQCCELLEQACLASNLNQVKAYAAQLKELVAEQEQVLRALYTEFKKSAPT